MSWQLMITFYLPLLFYCKYFNPLNLKVGLPVFFCKKYTYFPHGKPWMLGTKIGSFFYVVTVQHRRQKRANWEEFKMQQVFNVRQKTVFFEEFHYSTTVKSKLYWQFKISNCFLFLFECQIQASSVSSVSTGCIRLG